MKKLLFFIIMISVLITTILWFKYSKVKNNYAKLSNSNYLTHKIVKTINAGSYSNGFPVTVINDFSENEVRSVLFPDYMLVAAGGQIKSIKNVINVKTARKYNCLRGVLLKKLKLERDTMEVGESQCLTVIVESLAGTTCNSKVFLYSRNIEHAPKSQFIPFEIASGSIAELKWIITPLKSGKQTLLVSQGVYQELNNKSQQISLNVINTSEIKKSKKVIRETVERSMKNYKIEIDRNGDNIKSLKIYFGILIAITVSLFVIGLVYVLKPYLVFFRNKVEASVRKNRN